MDFFRFFCRWDIEVDDDRLLVTSHYNAQERLVSVGVYFLVRH